ncbi:hypothetical protein BC833DRAFT_588170 [Globomyces pollinis-pini]|nr:hypothetical protein BC833DRAFT_588170 [Globomyces pollinis-pini]
MNNSLIPLSVAMPAEYAIHVVLIIAQMIVCKKAWTRYKERTNAVQINLYLFLTHCIVLFGCILGLAIAIMVYSTLPNDYVTLLAESLENYSVQYYAYRVIYLVQLLTYQTALYILFYLQVERCRNILITTGTKMNQLFRIGLFGYLIILWILIIYNQFAVSDYKSWQQLQRNWLFHYLHASYFFVICASDILITLLGISRIQRWYFDLSSLMLTEKEIEQLRSNIPKISKTNRWLLVIDCINVTLALVIHFFGAYLFKNPRDKILDFRLCYLSVTLHFLAGFFYLDSTELIIMELLAREHQKTPVSLWQKSVTC